MIPRKIVRVRFSVRPSILALFRRIRSDRRTIFADSKFDNGKTGIVNAEGSRDGDFAPATP